MKTIDEIRINRTQANENRLQHALDARIAIKELLDAQGFKTMAQDVMDETEFDRIVRYVKVAVKNSPEQFRLRVANNFRLLGLF